MAQALARLGKLAEGLKEADAALAAAPDPSRLVCREARVRILLLAERYDQAAAECKDLLKDYTAPEEVREIRHTLSIVYSAAHEYDKAEEQLQLLLDADPNDPTANNDLGYQWAEQGKKLEEAEKLIRKAIDLDRKQRLTGTELDAESDRDNAAYVDSLGWVLFRRGQHEEARKELEKAVVLPDGIDDPVVWDHLGDVCFRLGDKEKAREALRQGRRTVRGRHASDRRTSATRKSSRSSHGSRATKGLIEDSRLKIDYPTMQDPTCFPSSLFDLPSSITRGTKPCQGIHTGQRSSTRRGPSTPSAASCGAS